VLEVFDGQGDDLTVDAIPVSDAPADWDGESARPLSDDPTARWVVKANSGIWLVESRLSRGACGGAVEDYITLYERALARVRASQLGL
jgi:hypothetical protein